MGLEEKINKIIRKLKERSCEISRILVIGKDLAVCSSEELCLSEEEIDFATKLCIVMEAVEDAEEELDLDFEAFIIKNARFSIIMRRITDKALIMVKVTNLAPARSLGVLAENGPSGTMTCINDAVEKIKAVLLKQ